MKMRLPILAFLAATIGLLGLEIRGGVSPDERRYGEQWRMSHYEILTRLDEAAEKELGELIRLHGSDYEREIERIKAISYNARTRAEKDLYSAYIGLHEASDLRVLATELLNFREEIEEVLWEADEVTVYSYSSERRGRLWTPDEVLLHFAFDDPALKTTDRGTIGLIASLLQIDTEIRRYIVIDDDRVGGRYYLCGPPQWYILFSKEGETTATISLHCGTHRVKFMGTRINAELYIDPVDSGALSALLSDALDANREE